MHSTRIFAVLIFAVGTAATCGKELPELAIWDGRAELVMSVRVRDTATHKPIRDAFVTLIRSQDAEIVPEDPPLPIPPPVRTDSRGFASLKATFDAEGDRHVTNLLV